MASAQVLRKQEHLEAGKRRLEEFRKKKVADRAKKAASNSQLQTPNVGLSEKQPSESEVARLTDSDGVSTSDEVNSVVVEPSGSGMTNVDAHKKTEFGQNSDIIPLDPGYTNLPSRTDGTSAYAADDSQMNAKFVSNEKYEMNDALGLAKQSSVNLDPHTEVKNGDFSINSGSGGRDPHLNGPYHNDNSFPQENQINENSTYKTSNYIPEGSQTKEKDSSFEKFTVANHFSSFTQATPENSATTLSQHWHDFTSMLDGGSYAILEESGMRGFPRPVPESLYTGFSSDLKSSSNHVFLYPAMIGTNSRRSRPSFLDSINVSGVSSSSVGSSTELQKDDSYVTSASRIAGTDSLASSAQKPAMGTGTRDSFSNSRRPVPSGFEPSISSTPYASNGDQLQQSHSGNSLVKKHEFNFPKQDDDFAALEQHIEDLTQEKFSLQRALEASQTLADSLAAENSSLTDSYNQQGIVVHQLKEDMEKLQEELKAQLVELDALRIEYANAQLECNAADERAKLLASEVIGLEEKALRLRSTELKLERQLENSNAEVSSYRKRISSLEKDRQDLQLTIDALQEEKKLLQSKLWKASGNVKSIEINKSPIDKKDVSTSSDDLEFLPDTSYMGMPDTATPCESDPTISSAAEYHMVNLDISFTDIPPDQMRTIQNITILISELSLEKEELVQALASESSQNSKLEDMNKELSQKLEAVTQRLELLTAQSMASGNAPIQQLDLPTLHESTAYADEGDEVVERVLGWIMKLFPGGPRRRNSKSF
ncbi:hypothetical protein RJ641_003756 [Dillenia turbinata]|uniref:Protein BLISTER-like n=1 Tax=Dillenia turbinata TaxID=194707 RepID=A0AAN8VHU7_9MAGN